MVTYTLEKQEQLVSFLNKCGVVCETFSNIENLVIPRETLLQDGKYLKLKDDIQIFRKQFSSSYLTSLQNTALNKQKWPLLNLVRQILKSHLFKLTPKRLCDGYTKDKKKKFRRVFVIEKIADIDEKIIDASNIEL